MSRVRLAGHPDFQSILPSQLQGHDRWLVWKAVPNKERPGKTRKIPYYVNGKVRKGGMDSPADLDLLSSFEDALEALDSGDYDGIGFAVADEGIGAFDLDQCLTEDMDLDPDHPAYPIATELEQAGAYMEISPSGKGLRAIGPCRNSEAYSKDGIEYWGQRRFVTLTAVPWANKGKWKRMDRVRDRLGSSRTAEKPQSLEDGPIITPRLVRELQDALKSIPADEYEVWIAVGNALKTLEDKGLELWLEWSATSDKFQRKVAQAKWDSFRPTNTGYAAVFAKAKDFGWVNPRSKKSLPEPEDEDDIEIDDFRFDLGACRPRHTEYILDGFLPTGVSVIAGAWGAGKSTNLIPLMTSVAHISPDWGFFPTLRRKVIWVTEAPEQAWDTLFAIARMDGAADWEEMKEWFWLFRAKRRSAKSLAKAIRKLIGDATYTLDNGFIVHPVIVLDTTSANIDLENESDNSMVSTAMSQLKERLPGVPLVLVGHTPKALVRGNVNDMTFRGAGAWEADATATYFLVHDQETDDRFLALRKARFSPELLEVSFGQESISLPVDTPWGETQSKTFVTGIPSRSSPQERLARQRELEEEHAEEVREAQMTERQRQAMGLASQMVDDLDWPTEAKIRAGMTGRNELRIEAIQRLLERGDLVAYDPVGKMRPPGPGRKAPILLPSEVDPEAFAERASNSVPEDGTE